MTNGRTDRLTDRRTDGRTEGRTDTDNYSNPPVHARRGLIISALLEAYNIIVHIQITAVCQRACAVGCINETVSGTEHNDNCE